MLVCVGRKDCQIKIGRYLIEIFEDNPLKRIIKEESDTVHAVSGFLLCVFACNH